MQYSPMHKLIVIKLLLLTVCTLDIILMHFASKAIIYLNEEMGKAARKKVHYRQPLSIGKVPEFTSWSAFFLQSV